MSPLVVEFDPARDLGKGEGSKCLPVGVQRNITKMSFARLIIKTRYTYNYTSCQRKKKGLILGVLLTIFTGVAINFITPFFLGERQSLVYYRFETIPFKEDDGEIAIYHIVFRNEGSIVLNEITAVISFEDAIIEKWNLSIDGSQEKLTG